MVNSDEEYALNLLKEYFTASNAVDVRCELVKNDPPDIVCCKGGEKWAVEVTRVDQREVQNGKEKSRIEIDVPLTKFGKKLGEQTKHLRRQKYSLSLNGPPSSMTWSDWKSQTTKIVEDFIKSDHRGEYPFKGGTIRTCEDGYDWLVTAGLREDTVGPGGYMTSDISANIRAMLRHALDDKVRKLARISGFDKVGLILLNTYLFGENVAEVANSLCTVIKEDQKYSYFDFVFYDTNGSLSLIYEKRVGDC